MKTLSNRAAERPWRIRNLLGERIGRLLVLRMADRAGGPVRWECACDCGITKAVKASLLLGGKTTSCGCYRAACTRSRQRTHGLTGSGAYLAYHNMMTRCYSKTFKAYKNYGARGIVVCDRWKNAPIQFAADMGNPPPGLSLDRIDVNGPYSKENCRWATKQEQVNNTRRNVVISAFGDRMNLTQWSKDPRCRVKYRKLRKLIARGEDPETVLSTP